MVQYYDLFILKTKHIKHNNNNNNNLRQTKCKVERIVSLEWYF